MTITVDGNTATSTSFTYSDAVTPSVTAISPKVVSPLDETVITITGTNFSNTMSEVTVKFYLLDPDNNLKRTAEFVHCNVTSSTTTQVVCNLLGGPKGWYDVVVEVGANGVNPTPDSALRVHIAFKIDSVTPSSGSAKGGTKVEIRGTGFS
jgi:hypothetical protein